ncbi:MAG: hypothetical protein MZU91_11835 [Desulfosudis oleivorans]|nr:hypothetical protein [Desulfosudis oleivorans]
MFNDLGRGPFRTPPTKASTMAYRGGGDHESPGGDQHDGGPRLLLHHGARSPMRISRSPSAGGPAKDILDGFYDLNGKVPCQIDGGLKCFGHPIGASGLRMLYEMYSQLLERWPEERRVKNPKFGLTHNLGGIPATNVCSVAIIGR